MTSLGDGYCSKMKPGNTQGCAPADLKGNWWANSSDSCFVLCMGCLQCHFVSYNQRDQQCWWFRRCPRLRDVMSAGPETSTSTSTHSSTGGHHTWQLRHDSSDGNATRGRNSWHALKPPHPPSSPPSSTPSPTPQASTVVICLCGLARSFILPSVRANLRSSLVDVVRHAGFQVHAYLLTSSTDSPRTAAYKAPNLSFEQLMAAMADLAADRIAVDLTTPDVARHRMQLARLEVCIQKWVMPLETHERSGFPVDFIVMTRTDIAYVNPVPSPTQWSRTALTVSQHNLVPSAPATAVSDHVLVAPSRLMKELVRTFKQLPHTQGDNFGAERQFSTCLREAARAVVNATVDIVDAFMVAVVRVNVVHGFAVLGRVECSRQRVVGLGDSTQDRRMPATHQRTKTWPLNSTSLSSTSLNATSLNSTPLSTAVREAAYHEAYKALVRRCERRLAPLLRDSTSNISGGYAIIDSPPPPPSPTPKPVPVRTPPRAQQRPHTNAAPQKVNPLQRTQQQRQRKYFLPNKVPATPPATLPAHNLTKRRLRTITDVALLVTGGVRTLATQRVYDNLRRTRTALSGADLFLYLDPGQVRWASQVGYSEKDYTRCAAHARVPPGGSSQSVLQLDLLLKQLAPTAHAEFDDCRAFGSVPATYASQSAAVWASALSFVRPINCTFRKYRRTYPQFLWAAKAFDLLTQYEAVHQPQRYQWIFKLRPDMIFPTDPPIPLPPLPNVPTVFAPGYLPGTHMIIDWWALMTRSAAESYFSTAAISFRNCDALQYPSEGICSPKLDPRDVECLLSRHLLSSEVKLDTIWADRFPTLLVHYGAPDVPGRQWGAQGSVGNALGPGPSQPRAQGAPRPRDLSRKTQPDFHQPSLRARTPGAGEKRAG